MLDTIGGAPHDPTQLNGTTALSYGAAPEDWQHLEALGLTHDLLPVVSNPTAEISPQSSIKQLGKTPSLFNRHRQVVGMKQWTDHVASPNEIRRWSKDRDLGICIQTRETRGLDIDVVEPAVAEAIVAAVAAALGMKLPARRRGNSGKCLLAFRLVGEFPKRIMRVEGGMIEFLGNGQQFIAVGTHPSGARYEWEGGLPAEIPTLTAEQFEDLWTSLEMQFALEEPREFQLSDRKRGDHLDIADPVATWLADNGLVLGEDRRGGLLIECPWQDEHSGGEPGDSSTMWLLAGSNGHASGHFRCLHAHCEHRTRQDFLSAVGFVENVADDFEDLGPDPDAEKGGEKGDPFEVIPAHIFAAQPAGGYIIEDVIPDADIGMIYGGSTDGKTFVMLDMSMAVARGVPWRGKKVKQGKVVYIVAEGGGGFRKRLNAYAIHNQIKLEDVPFGVIHAAPNLLDREQVNRICASIVKNGARVIVVDTFAQTTPGSNENAGEDVGKAIANIRAVGKKVGAMVILVHHTGKDASRGARGWSGLRAAADFELEVVRDGENRMINTTKQKDGDDTESWGFKLLEVPISMNEDGKIITSCVIVENDVPVEGGVRGGKRSAKPEKKHGAWEQAILETYAELAVGGDVLKTELILVAADKRPDAGTVKNRRKNAKRALETLCRGSSAELMVEEEYVFHVE